VFPFRRSGYWGKDAGGAEVDVLAIRNGDVGTTGEVRWSALPTRGFTVREAERAMVHAGDILLTTSGNCGNVAAIDHEPDHPTAATNFVRLLRCDSRVAQPRYAYHFLRTRGFTDGIAPFVRGATIKNLSVDEAFDAIDIPTPPLHEQRRIAAILDQADVVRAKRHEVLTALEALTKSVFHDMFQGEPAAKKVEDIAVRIRTGPFGSQLLHSEFVDEGIAVLGLDNVVSNEFRWGERRFITRAKYEKLKRYTVRPGDVLISIMGTTGRCVVVPDDIPTAINTKHICAITPDSTDLDSAFLRAAFLWHPESRAHLRHQTKGSIMDGLNMGIIKAMPIPVPPISRQREFAERARKLIGVRDTMTRAAAVDDSLFASVQSRAFRGDL
jgi:type I restriction enzyme S subunit